MNIREELFYFIKSLDRNEKGYFRRHFSNGSGQEKDYIRLFDILEEAGSYNEQEIKRQCVSEDFANRLPVVKNYLFGQLEKSLLAYRAESSEYARLVRSTLAIEIYLERGFHDRCERLIRKAKRIARKYEYLYELLKVIDLELALWAERKKMEIRAGVLKEKGEVLQLLNNWFEYQLLMNEAYRLHFHVYRVRSKKEVGEFRKLMNSPLLKDQRRALSFKTKSIYYDIHGLYARAVGNYKRSADWHRKHVEIIEGKPHIIEEKPWEYIKRMLNLLLSMGELRDPEGVRIWAGRIRKAAEKYSSKSETKIRAYAFVYTYTQEIDVNFALGNYQRCEQLLPGILNGVEQYEKEMTMEHKTVFYANLSHIYFALNDHSNALYWLNRVLNETDPNLRRDVHGLMRMLNIMIHYEKGNRELLDTIIRSATRFFEKQKRLFRFEEVFLNSFKQIIRAKNKKEETVHLKKLDQELKALQQVPYESNLLEFLDIVAWVESKLTGTSFAEEVRKKHHSAHTT